MGVMEVMDQEEGAGRRDGNDCLCEMFWELVDGRDDTEDFKITVSPYLWVDADGIRWESKQFAGRCFPFLFVELDTVTLDLQDAHYANLLSTSQALYNIYRCMSTG